MKVFHFSEFYPKGHVNKLQQVVMYIPGFRELSRNFLSSSLFLCRLTSWWILLVLLSFSTGDSGFFFAHPGQLSPGVSCTSLRSHIELRTFHPFGSSCVSCHLFAGGLGRLWNSQYFTRLHHLLFPPYTDTLIMWPGCDWTNISPPRNCVQAWEWGLAWNPSNWALATFIICFLVSWEPQCCFPHSFAWSTCSYQSQFSSCGDSV